MKKGKTNKLVALASVLALACACGATQALVPSAYEAPVGVYAEETKPALVADFEALVGELDATVTDATLVDTEDAQVAGDTWYAHLQYLQITSAANAAELIAAIDADVMAVYEVYRDAFASMIEAAGKADDAYGKVLTAIAGAEIIYANEKAAYMANFDLSAFSTAEQDIINTFGSADRLASKAEVEAYFDGKAALEVLAQNAVDAIAQPIAIASLADIEAAYDAVKAVYGTIDLDVLADDQLVYTLIETLDAYMVEYDALVAAVNELKDDIKALAGMHANGELNAKVFSDAKKAYNALTAEQKGLIDTDTLDNGNTYSEELAEYDRLYAQVYVAANLAINAIKAIPQPITIDAADEIAAARAAYDNFIAKGYSEGYISNREVLFTAEAELAEITADVEEWKAEVDKLPEAIDIVITDEADVIALVEFYDAKAFTAEMQAYIIANENTHWTKYNAVQASIVAIKAEIAAVANLYLNLPAVEADYETELATYIAEVVAFDTAYEAAVDAFTNGLSADEQAYLLANHEDAVDAKAAAELAYEIYGVEGKILAIRDVNTLECATDLVLADGLATVDAADAAFKALSAEKQANFKTAFTVKLGAATAQIKAIRDGLDAWAAKVNAGIAADYITLDYAAGGVLDTYVTEFNAFDADCQAYAAVAEAKAALDAVLADIQANIDEINAEIQRIKGVSVLTANDRASLANITSVYEAMHQSQKDLIVEYEDVIAATLVRIQKAEFVEVAIAAINVDTLTIDGLVQVKAIRALYENLNDEIKGLVTNVAVLEAAEAAYAADDAAIYDIAFVKTALEAADKAIEDAYKAADDEINALITALDAAYKAADTALDTAYKAADAAIDAAYKAADAQLKSDLEAADAAMKSAYESADADLQAKIDALDAAYKAADKAIEDAYKAADAEINSTIADLDAAYKAADIALKAAYEAGDAAVVEQLNGVKTALEAAIKAEEDARKAADAAMDAAYKAADAAIDAAYKAADTELDAAYKAADAAMKAAYEAADAALQAAIDAMDAAYKAADAALDAKVDAEIANRLAAEKALEEKLMAEIKSLNTKLIVASVVLAVFTAALIGAVVYLFIGKKKN